MAERSPGLPDVADVLIIGCGPAGLLLAAQLAAFPELRTVIVDRRDGPLQVGQADGVVCRTVEIFETFGLAGPLTREGYQVNEVTFWRPDPAGHGSIVRTGRINDVEDDLSEMPHVIVNQARMLMYLRAHMRRSATWRGPTVPGAFTFSPTWPIRAPRTPGSGHWPSSWPRQTRRSHGSPRQGSPRMR